MSNISEVSLRDLLTLERRPVKVHSDEKYAEIGIYCFGRGIFHKTPRSGLEVGDKQLFLIKEGDFILQVTFAWEGAVALASAAEDGMYGSTRFPTFRVNEHLCFPPYLVHYFRTPAGLEQLIQISPGSAGRNRVLSIKRIPEIRVPLPSLEEQRRIVGRIEELVAKVDEARGLRSQSVEELNAIARSTARVAFSACSNCHLTVEELVGRANLKNGKSIKTVDQPSKIHCIRLSAVREGQIDCNDAKPVPMSVEEAKDYLVESGDVFVVRGNGSKDLVGQAGLVKCCPEGTIFPDLFIRVPLDQDRILPSFFVAWWNSPQMRDRIQDAAKTTSGIWKINQGHIASFSVPVPPISEQQAIVTYLTELQNKVDSLRQLQIETARELDALLPSILDKAFKGEL